jgi:hypothetical protein
MNNISESPAFVDAPQLLLLLPIISCCAMMQRSVASGHSYETRMPV